MLGAACELGAEAACEWAAGTGARLGTTLVAPGGGRREYAVVGELMGARGWHACGEPLDEGERVKGDGGCAVAPMSFEAVDDSAVGCEREALGRDGRPSHIAAQMLELLELAGGDEHLGVQ